MNDISNPYEEQEIRCPKLGGPVTFSYCCVEARNLPCSRAIRCWCDRFDVESFFMDKLGEDKFRLAFEKPQQSKLENILELIDRAKKIVSEDSEQSK
ncbi:MAG: hypothetical protein M1511_00080 [Deltaproteobacteria bacterium]|nr:hypothetical protein [Deltaproteobacteria bacterium]